MSKIIFLNGTSSSGKTTLAKAIQEQIDNPFWHFSSDQFVEAGMLPKFSNSDDRFDWKRHRPAFFNAFHACIKAVLDTGNNMILDHIIESHQWYRQIQSLLTGHDVFFVGLHCPIETLRSREQQRADKHSGNRYAGEAEYHLQHVHSYSAYDFEINTTEHTTRDAAHLVIDAWHLRERSKFFMSS